MPVSPFLSLSPDKGDLSKKKNLLQVLPTFSADHTQTSSQQTHSSHKVISPPSSRSSLLAAYKRQFSSQQSSEENGSVLLGSTVCRESHALALALAISLFLVPSLLPPLLPQNERFKAAVTAARAAAAIDGTDRSKIWQDLTRSSSSIHDHGSWQLSDHSDNSGRSRRSG